VTAASPIDVSPPFLFPDYQITLRRAPAQRLVQLPRGWFHTIPGPVFGRIPVGPTDNDLLHQHAGEPLGLRIVLAGRVLDSDGRGVPGTLIEIWQTNASGRYVDPADPGFVPLDPNFTGAGRTITDSLGGYRFKTIKPAPYLGARNSWFRPAHIHVSLFNPQFGLRLITQCYFEGDPLIRTDPIVQAIGDPRGIDRLTAKLNLAGCDRTGDEATVAYDWDIVIRGREATPMEA
jgi:protocatechuate 3,4-dioxygenase beta subunit